MILQLFNLKMDQVAELSVYSSISMERSHSGVGKLTLHLNPRSPNAYLIQRDMLLMPIGRPKYTYIVEDIEQGRDSLIVRGVQLKGLVRRRICVPPLNLPARLWRYTAGSWQAIDDKEAIKALLGEEIFQSYTKPEAVTEGLLWLDLNDMASVYNWDKKAKVGEVWLDLERAQVRSKYKNFGYDRITADAETAILHYIANNVTAPEDALRKMENAALAENGHRGKKFPWQARFDKLADVLQRISEATGIGWTAEPDIESGKIIFRCYEGKDLTDAGSGRVVTISIEMNNAGDVKYREQSSMAANVAYVGGAGEDENRMILAIPPAGGSLVAGLERSEVWSEAGSTDDPAIARLAGEKRLAETGVKQTVTADVLDSGALCYGRDWDVGDIVLVELKGARRVVRMEARVNAVTETIETDRARHLSVVFGDAPVSINSLIDSASKPEAVR